MLCAKTGKHLIARLSFFIASICLLLFLLLFSHTLSTHAASATSTNWPSLGFDTQNTRDNTTETALSPTSVSHLHLAWKFRTPFVVKSSPLVNNGTAYISAYDSAGHLYALDAKTGTQRWSLAFGGAVTETPVINNGVLYAGAETAIGSVTSMFAVNATTGTILWQTATKGHNDYTAPLVVNGIVYASFDDGNLYAFNTTTGKIVWSASIGNEYSAVAVVNNVLYVGSSNGYLNALNAQTGRTLWSVVGPTNATSSLTPVVVNSTVYIASQDEGTNQGYVAAYSLSSHKQIWNKLFKYAVGNSLAVAGTTLYVGDNDGSLYALNTANGATRWSTVLDTQIESAPAVANGVVYVGGMNSGTLFAVNARTGAKLWSYTTGGFIELSSATVVNGMVYIGSDDFSVYAFQL